MKVAIISCGKMKKTGTHKARDMYTSPLFRLALSHAEANYDAVYILSAKHGLLALDKRIRSYDISLSRMSRAERKKWSLRVANEISDKFSPHFELDFFWKFTLHFFCGKLYRNDVIKHIVGIDYLVPLAGLSIGKQLKWYKDHNTCKEKEV